MMKTSLVLLSLALCVAAAESAQSRDGWEGRTLVCDPAVISDGGRLSICQQWISTVKQPDTRISCCGDGDAYIADAFETKNGKFYAIITADYPGDSNAGEPMKKGTKILIPANKLNHAAEDGGNPSGHGVVFLSANGEVLCYFGPTLS
jgi:hypothetical protein